MISLWLMNIWLDRATEEPRNPHFVSKFEFTYFNWSRRHWPFVYLPVVAENVISKAIGEHTQIRLERVHTWVTLLFEVAVHAKDNEPIILTKKMVEKASYR